MKDTPIGDAVRDIPKNELLVKGGASSAGGANVNVTIEHEKQLENGDLIAGGAIAGIEQNKGWSVAGFFRWMWK